jgi:Outer membrane lipoprotein carrier protein LolA-like
MTFGKSSRSLSARLAAVLFYWFVLLSPAAMSLAETPAQTEREEESTTWNVERLIDSLAKHRQAKAQFEETGFSTLLTEPLKTQGILYFTPPATFEKHVTAPQDERYLIQGDKVVFENKGKAINRSLSLQDYPVLRAFVEAFRSTLTNDVVTLKRFYLVTLQGTPRRWVLILHPLNKAVQELVESIRFSGEEEQLRSIETREPDGDRSLMVITSGAQ